MSDINIEKSRFDDLVRRIDHHAHVLRTSPIDFFRTSALAQAGSLFAVLTLVFNATTRTDQRGIHIHLLDELILPVRIVMITLGAGAVISIIGYIFCYSIARRQQKRLRKNMDAYLFDGVAIKAIDDPLYYYVPWFIFGTMIEISILVVVIGWFIEIAWSLM